jgi:hypothetical protein
VDDTVNIIPVVYVELDERVRDDELEQMLVMVDVMIDAMLLLIEVVEVDDEVSVVELDVDDDMDDIDVNEYLLLDTRLLVTIT